MRNHRLKKGETVNNIVSHQNARMKGLLSVAQLGGLTSAMTQSSNLAKFVEFAKS